ncbi:MAG: polysaccharide biosynthesis/export family protein [Pseudomonadota bacterium]
MRFRTALTALLPAFMMASGCSSSLGSLPPLPAISDAEAYRLAPGDEVRVFVYGLEAASNTFTINDEGALTLPLVGPIAAGGMTVTGLESAISMQLVERAIVTTPNVNVQPVNLRPFYILGEVRNPGEYPYRYGLTVLSAVSVAGGYTFRAEEERVAITRIVNGERITGLADETTVIQPGDTIRVHETWF